jgi:hypothetical protein
MGCIRTRGCGGEVERDGRHAVFGRELLSQMGWISTDEEGGLTPFRIWLGGATHAGRPILVRNGAERRAERGSPKSIGEESVPGAKPRGLWVSRRPWTPDPASAQFRQTRVRVAAAGSAHHHLTNEEPLGLRLADIVP